MLRIYEVISTEENSYFGCLVASPSLISAVELATSSGLSTDVWRAYEIGILGGNGTELFLRGPYRISERALNEGEKESSII